MGYIVAYFKCEERDYMIYANDSTYLAEIINNRAVNIDTLIRYPIRIIDYFHQRNTKLSKGVQTGILHYKMNDQLCNQFSFYIKNDSIIINKSKMKCY